MRIAELKRLLVQLHCICLFAGLTPGCLWASVDDPATLVIGQISLDPKVAYPGLEAIVNFAAAEMHDVGVRQGKVIIARSTEQMASYLRQGKVDWVTETLGNGLLLSHRTGAEIIANRWKGGRNRYNALIIVRRDSSIDSLADLKGRTIAFEQRNSTTGFLLPAAAMVAANIDLTLMGSPLDRPTPELAGYFFSNEEINTSAWVYRGLVDAGCISSADWDNPEAVPESFKNDLSVIYRSPELPRALELVRNDLPKPVRDRLLEVLVGADTQLSGQTAMSEFSGTTRFEPFDPSRWQYLEEIWQEISTMLAQLMR